MPAKKAPSANDTPNSFAAPKATPSAIASTAKPEQFARAGMRDVVQDPGNDPAADHQHQADEDDDLDQGQHRRRRQARGRAGAASGSNAGLSPLAALSTPASAGSSTSASTIARSSTISQPTAMRPRSVSIRRRSCSARSSTTVLATDKRQAEDEAGAERPAEQP